jgi:hypothetical protein
MTAREMMARAIDRAIGYQDDDKLYQLHLFYAQELGELAGYSSEEVLNMVRQNLQKG